ncbi:hypothetical protein JNUCC0626_04240 [Lentzea sp. JNUCC 0626]|uniref:hypothetical protein n=1 Tax=Lentzea sp. JNUCC 0626 TaxID=3367513 RepID=UPI00374A8BD0
MATKTKPKKKSRSPKEKQEVTGGDLAKTKSEAPAKKTETLIESAARLRLSRRDTDFGGALRDAFGVEVFDSDTPPAARKGYEFDSTELTRLADRVKTEADKLATKNDETQYNLFANRLLDLTLRTSEVRAIAERTAKIEELMASMSTTADRAELKASMTELKAAKASGDLARVRGWLSDVEGRLATMQEIIDLVKAKSGATENRIPDGLFPMAGSDLGVLKRGLGLIPAKYATISELRIAFSRAEPASALPDLHRLADELQIEAARVERQFDRPGQTGKAVNAMKAIRDSGGDTDFFMTGPGAQTWKDLEWIGARGLKAWSGGTVGPVHIGPLDEPSISLAELRRQAVRPRPGTKKLAPDQQGQDPTKPRYLGNKPYINDVLKRGVVLPSVDGAGRFVRYTEYDIRPYTKASARGGERLVVGGGRTFYTNDHYVTFVEVL